MLQIYDKSRILIKGNMNIISSKKLRLRVKIRKLKTKLTIMEDNWFAQFIAAEILLNASKMIGRARTSIHFVSTTTVTYSFTMQRSQVVQDLLSSNTHLLSITHTRVNHTIKSSRLKLITIDNQGVIRYKCIWTSLMFGEHNVHISTMSWCKH